MRASKSSKSKKLKVTPFSAKELKDAYSAERVKELEEVGALMALP